MSLSPKGSLTGKTLMTLGLDIIKVQLLYCALTQYDFPANSKLNDTRVPFLCKMPVMQPQS